MTFQEAFYIQKGNIFAVPCLHYNMELACQVKLAFETLKPDCVAVELPETMQLQMLHCASRLPDISIAITHNKENEPLYILSEPCDGIFEALRSAAESQIPSYCIDLDVDYYPDVRDAIPDPYAIQRIGLKAYYNLFDQSLQINPPNISQIDQDREMYMARRLKELSLSYDRILFVGGMAHTKNILKLIDLNSFPQLKHANRELVQVSTLTPESCREVMAEWGFLSTKYEEIRNKFLKDGLLDRQKCMFQLYKEASDNYIKNTGNDFPGYHLRNTMKFVRNYALIRDQLMPDLFKILSAARSCVDHNYAYEVWDLATTYPHLKNIDGLQEYDLTIEDIWGDSKVIRFHMKQKGRKEFENFQKRKDRSQFKFKPPGPFTICSFPPEDIAIERFADFLKKKGSQILTDETSRTVPFSTSLEEGIDTRETIRHWHEHKLYVKMKGKPPSGVGSVCVIFDEDMPIEGKIYHEKYSWQTTWHGEHQQESDMAFYATPISQQVIGPGISRCEYGGFLMSYPPRRILNIWTDPDYSECRSKSEILLMAAIDYASKPVVVYVASTPPRTIMKSFARRFGKKIVYIPIGQLSPVTLNKLRNFHVLDGHDKREIADEYIN
ncbi:MAG: hypothetical protein H0W88_02530 [Parachlamydiaceae bacterium]|nr:hypothetical protein [Parachlamydiaceae bacterium]